jgi:hypothetical protein
VAQSFDNSREDVSTGELTGIWSERFTATKFQNKNASCSDEKTTNFSTSNESAIKLLFGKTMNNMNFDFDEQLLKLQGKF